MSFSVWLENRILLEGKKSKKSIPVTMPKEVSSKIELKEPSPERIPKGRRNTTFKSGARREGTRGAIIRKSVSDS